MTIHRFASLPKPKETEWDLELPEEQQETNGEIELSEEDAAERDRRNQALRDAAERAEFKRRTQVLQRALPRPSHVDIDVLFENVSHVSDPIEQDIAKEMSLLIANDARKYPAVGSNVKGPSRSLELFDDDALDRARVEIALEMPSEGREEREEDFAASWSMIHDTSSELPGLASYENDEVDEDQARTEAFDVSDDGPVQQYSRVLKAHRIFKAQS